jgi:hypothetical protein
MFVTGARPYCGGPGIHQRIILRARSLLVIWMTGAGLSGKIAGKLGRPVVSRVARGVGRKATR